MLNFVPQVKDEIYIYSTEGERLTRVAPDFVGAVNLNGRRSQAWFFATLTGFTNPGIVAQYDFSKKQEQWSIYRTTILKGLIASDFEAQQVNKPVSTMFLADVVSPLRLGLV